MKRRIDLVLTAFEPFGGKRRNPSAEVLRSVRRRLGSRVLPILLPVDHRKMGALALPKILTLRPRFAVFTGEAGGRPRVSVERIAVNRRDFRVPDNAGRMPKGEKIVDKAPEFLEATWPARRLLSALRRAGVPARESFDAGRHCCNHILFEALWLARSEGLVTRSGFLHLPFLESQVVELDRDEASMSIETLRLAVLTVVRTLLA